MLDDIHYNLDFCPMDIEGTCIVDELASKGELARKGASTSITTETNHVKITISTCDLLLRH